METQRQWTPLAIARTTPARWGLFSLVTLLAHPALTDQTTSLPHTAWYGKARPTCADALALVRRRLWVARLVPTAACPHDPENMLPTLAQRWCDLLCSAA